LRKSLEESTESVCLIPAANTRSHKIPAAWSQNFTEDVPIVARVGILRSNLEGSL